jgi:hypothetical protein
MKNKAGEKRGDGGNWKGKRRLMDERNRLLSNLADRDDSHG